MSPKKCTISVFLYSQCFLVITPPWSTCHALTSTRGAIVDAITGRPFPQQVGAGPVMA